MKQICRLPCHNQQKCISERSSQQKETRKDYVAKLKNTFVVCHKRRNKYMFWFSELLDKEFIDFFTNEKSVYFTVTDDGRVYHKTFKKFSDTIDKLHLLLIANEFDEEHYNKYKESQNELYELSGGFFKEKRELITFSKLGDLYRNIGDNLFDCDIVSLTAEQLAIGLMYLFLRMDVLKDRFAESGRLREWILTMHDKANRRFL